MSDPKPSDNNLRFYASPVMTYDEMEANLIAFGWIKDPASTPGTRVFRRNGVKFTIGETAPAGVVAAGQGL